MENKKLQKFNLNYGVWFHVTEAGKTHMSEKQNLYLKHTETKKIEGKTYHRLQLYDVMNLYGESLYCGCNPPIEPTIYLEFE